MCLLAREVEGAFATSALPHSWLSRPQRWAQAAREVALFALLVVLGLGFYLGLMLAVALVVGLAR